MEYSCSIIRNTLELNRRWLPRNDWRLHVNCDCDKIREFCEIVKPAIIDSGEIKSPLAMIISNMMAGVFAENNKVARCLLAVFSVLNAQGFFVFCQSNSGCDGGMTPTFLVIHTPDTDKTKQKQN